MRFQRLKRWKFYENHDILKTGGAPVSTGTSSGYRSQMERSSPDWAKHLTANKTVSYDYALAA